LHRTTARFGAQKTRRENGLDLDLDLDPIQIWI
jgi:hypothetical protein